MSINVLFTYVYILNLHIYYTYVYVQKLLRIAYMCFNLSHKNEKGCCSKIQLTTCTCFETISREKMGNHYSRVDFRLGFSSVVEASNDGIKRHFSASMIMLGCIFSQATTLSARNTCNEY